MISRNQPPHAAPPRRLRGFTIVELIGALLLLGIAMGVTLPLMVTISAQRKAAEQRQSALLHAENLLDRCLAHPWPEVTTERLNGELAEPTSSLDSPLPVHLPQLARHITVTERPDDAAREITVELRWHDAAGQETAPVKLSGWKFSPAETSP